MKQNYDLAMQAVIDGLHGCKKTLLLHSCCGPCSSAVLERVTPFFDVTIYYFNPNIHPQEEYEKRLSEQKRLLNENGMRVGLLESAYEPEKWFAFIKGTESEPEGGARCEKCFEFRLDATAEAAKKNGFDYFATTLTVSPHKNAELVNRSGDLAAAKTGILFLPADFKKHDGYLRSLRLSRQYGLYRQNYCGCVYSLRENHAEDT